MSLISAAKFHSMRVYYQVQEWITLQGSMVNFGKSPLDWGWEITANNAMLPIYCDEPAAPEELLACVSCKCKTDCKNSSCSCVQHGLVCGKGCKVCRGESCMNTLNKAIHVDDSDISDED